MGVLGVEPRTSSLSGTRSNQLSYTPAGSTRWQVGRLSVLRTSPASGSIQTAVLTQLPVSETHFFIFGGAEGARTLDILLAKQVL